MPARKISAWNALSERARAITPAQNTLMATSAIWGIP